MSTAANYVAMTLSGTPGTGPATLLAALAAPNQSFLSAYGAVSAAVDVEWYSDAAGTTPLGVERNCTFNGGNPGTLTRGTAETPGSLVSIPAGASVRVVLPASAINAYERQLDLGTVFVGNANGTSQGSLTNNGFTKIAAALNVVNSDPNAWWSVANKRLLPNRAGQYQISCGVQLTGQAGGVVYQAALYKNGAAVKFGSTGADGGAVMNVEALVSLNGSSDYAELYIYVSNSAGASTLGGSENRVTLIASYQGA